MREILFRGKRKDTGEWVYGSFCKTDDTYFTSYASYPDNHICVYEDTIGQYIELLDDNYYDEEIHVK